MRTAAPHPSALPTFAGTLRSWDAARGYGFIAPRDGGRELFVHVSAFPRDGSHPVVGETLTFERGAGRDGRPQAVRVVRGAWAGAAASRAAAPSRARSTRARFGWRRPTLVLLLVLVLAAAAALGLHARRPAPGPARVDAPPAFEPARAMPVGSSFRCDGRTRCGQMTSCAEATYFLRYCPGTTMDGDGDVVPCEQQWCTGASAR